MWLLMWLLSTIVSAAGLVLAFMVVFVAAALLLLRLSTHRGNQAQADSITGNWSSNTSTSTFHVHKTSVDNLSGSFAKRLSSAPTSGISDSWTVCQLTPAPTLPVRSYTNHTGFYTALASLGTEHCRSLLPLSLLQTEETFRLIPAPLWQEVAIPADRVCIAQTPAGQDWMLGQGSYGKVSYT